ncbi:DNA repair helicase XPB [Treponema sp. Marseille-Q3903]|uniref:DNA repair helicase XPB n=1 Tax=Treponema sp. Marseille-Q3903 TaxID=2766703 RepID=UPI0016522A4B|nr:DNA repair helicase XPB [Treponema sp. Marseille-Q3903]MBC6714443.1 DEAD/DEAH box helicase [Treponema sp. Marseille-Q3903]
MNYENPLIVQGDHSLLLDVHAPLAEECRNALIPFAELEKSPEHLHTYKLSPLSLWNAASAGFTADEAIAVLEKYARYDVPQSIPIWIKEISSRFGKIKLIEAPDIEVPENGNSSKKITEHFLYLVADSLPVFKEIGANQAAKKMLTLTFENSDAPEYSFLLKLTDRGTIKQILLQSGWPVKDEVALTDGEHLDISLRKTTLHGKPLIIREYQKNSARALVGDKRPGTGFGTIVLPCGAGKTIVGMEIMEMLKTSTLIITTNISAVHQWIDELLDKTDLTSDKVSEYSGETKTIKQVTVATYQVLTWRPDKDGPYPHFSIFHKRHWGLIIYDEVHMLPAPVFRVVAELQAVRRVGLTATLVREDGCEGYVFSLVGPKRYDVPWKELEREHWIASAECIEVRVDLPSESEIDYAVASPREKHKIASMNKAKLPIVKEIIDKCPTDKILVIGQYLSQLEDIAKELDCILITGKTPNSQRDKIYSDFREGKIKVLVVSKVANFAIDLPDASLAIQVSGTFGSRQEEAQRLGRILRPKEQKSRFFTLITRNTVEEQFGSNRQKFLAEQGYEYKIIRYDGELDIAD